MATEAEILEILTLLRLNFPDWGRNKDDATIRQTNQLYCNRLAPIPADVLQEVALQVIDTAIFFPKISELKQPALARMRQHRALAHEQKLLEQKAEAVPHAEGVRRLREIWQKLAGKFGMGMDPESADQQQGHPAQEAA